MKARDAARKGSSSSSPAPRQSGPTLQRYARDTAPPSSSPLIDRVANSPGQPLDPAARAFLEPRFAHEFTKTPVSVAGSNPPGKGFEHEADRVASRVMTPHSFDPTLRHDFGGVRIHTGREADEAARAANARAYTMGNDVVFAAGRYAPETLEGGELLAHELTHVVQQESAFTPALQCKAERYDPTVFTITPPAKPFTLDDAKNLVEKMKTATPPGLTVATISGAVPGSEAEIFVWFTLAQVASSDRWGSEIDLVTPIGWRAKPDDADPVGKVTVRIDAAGKASAELLSTGPVAAPPAFVDAAAELKKTYGIVSVTDGDSSWSPSDLNKVIGAFGLLPAGDRAALAGVDLKRVKDIPGGHAGEFGSSQSVTGTSATSPATLKLADSAFLGDDKSFTGDKANSSPASYMTIVHEVGHAIASKAERDAGTALVNATAASNKLVDPLTQALSDRNAATDEANSLIVEYNALVNTSNSLNKSGDKAAIAAAKKDVADKRKEVEAKRKEVNVLKQDEDAKRAALTASKTNVKTKETLVDETRISATSLEPFKTSAQARKAVATAARKGADGRAAKFGANDASESGAYRTAVADAEKAIVDFMSEAAKKDADVEQLTTSAQSAIDSRDTERANLQTASGTNPALAAYTSVETAQDAWFKAAQSFAFAAQRTKRVQKFVEFVTANKIDPFTKYASDNWPNKPEEFFAEAYSLWRGDPDYLKNNAKLLFDWFVAGKYLK